VNAWSGNSEACYLYDYISAVYFCNRFMGLHVFVSHLVSLGNGSLNIFPWKRTHAAIEKLKNSKSNWWSVSQYVFVSSSLWNPWPDIIFCLKVAVLPLWGALSDERSGLSPVSHCHQYLVHCQRFNIIYIVHVTCFMYMQYIYYTSVSTGSVQQIMPKFTLQQQSRHLKCHMLDRRYRKTIAHVVLYASRIL
jgi:hypothetical protein